MATGRRNPNGAALVCGRVKDFTGQRKWEGKTHGEEVRKVTQDEEAFDGHCHCKEPDSVLHEMANTRGFSGNSDMSLASMH